MTAGWPETWTCTIRGSLTAPVLGIYFQPSSSTARVVFNVATWESSVLLRPYGCIHAGTLLRSVFELLRFCPEGMQIYTSCSHPRQASQGQVPLLIKSSTSQSRVACFFLWSPPTLWVRPVFTFHPESPQAGWLTNNYYFSI